MALNFPMKNMSPSAMPLQAPPMDPSQILPTKAMQGSVMNGNDFAPTDSGIMASIKSKLASNKELNSKLGTKKLMTKTGKKAVKAIKGAKAKAPAKKE